MGLVSMKMTPAEAKDATAMPAEDAKDQPRYPWGLSLTLADETLTRLGLSLPEVDDVVTVTARATVTSVSANGTQGAGERRSVGLQITDLAIEGGAGADEGETATKRYGGAKG
jgi:hypothetical protein